MIQAAKIEPILFYAVWEKNIIPLKMDEKSTMSPSDLSISDCWIPTKTLDFTTNSPVVVHAVTAIKTDYDNKEYFLFKNYWDAYAYQQKILAEKQATRA